MLALNEYLVLFVDVLHRREFSVYINQDIFSCNKSFSCAYNKSFLSLVVSKEAVNLIHVLRKEQIGFFCDLWL